MPVCIVIYHSSIESSLGNGFSSLPRDSLGRDVTLSVAASISHLGTPRRNIRVIARRRRPDLRQAEQQVADVAIPRRPQRLIIASARIHTCITEHKPHRLQMALLRQRREHTGRVGA